MYQNIQKLKTYQQEDGGFTDSKGKGSVFYTARVLSYLAMAGEASELSEIKKKAADFLLSRLPAKALTSAGKSREWKFNGSLLADFCVLTALAEYDKSIIDAAGLAAITKRLTEIETQEGGPYALPDGSIDGPANAAVARFLAIYDVELPALSSFQETVDENYGASFTDALQAAKKIASTSMSDSERPPEKTENQFTFGEQQIMDLIFQKAEKRFAHLSSEFRERATNAIKKTIRGNPDKQMALMAYYMKQALGERADTISDDLVAEIGLANIFFWTAFIIYDDFWDGDEEADPELLPVANLFARHYTDFFSTLLPDDSGFRSFFHTVMDELDEANMWELRHCRVRVEASKFYVPKKLPAYGSEYDIKYKPASGHIFGPVAMLIQLGYPIDSLEVQNLIEYFRHYLIAMQLNDDAHDWEEDMGRGHISTSVDLLLRELEWRKPTIDLRKDLPELKKVFWFRAMPKYARLTISHAEKSLKALRSIGIFEDAAPLERIAEGTKVIAEQALREQEQSEEFLAAYNSS